MCTMRVIPMPARISLYHIREHRLYGICSTVMNSEQLSLRQRRSAAIARLNIELRNKNDFSGGAGLENFFVSTHGLRKRQFLADHGAKRAVFEASDEAGVDFRLFGRRNAPKRETRGWKRGGASVSRALIVISPRLPMTMTRPFVARSFVSGARFTLASISRTMSTPRPPVAFMISS